METDKAATDAARKVRDKVARFAEKLNNGDELTETEQGWKRAIERVCLKYRKRFDPQWSKQESYQCSLLAMLEFDKPEQLRPTYIELRSGSRHEDSIRNERKLNRWKYVKGKSGKLRKREPTDEYELIDERKAIRAYGMKDIEQLISVLAEHDKRFAKIAELILVYDCDHPTAYKAVGVSPQRFYQMKLSAAKFMKARAEQFRRDADLCELFGNMLECW